MNITSIYHININCTNFERSFAFYKMLGFKEVVDFGEGTGPQMAGLKLPGARGRSEEHTSELQSLRHLVCRLLLEKKKKKDRAHNEVQQTQPATTDVDRSARRRGRDHRTEA